MSDRDVIRIADLAQPVLTTEQQQALAAASANPPTLTVDAVLSAASERAGLDDFGPDDFRARLALLLEELESPVNTDLAKAAVYHRMVRAASNRLLTMDLLRRHPEIHDVQIERPIIIAGLPRSGTTHLLNLLGADTRFRSLLYWESLEPIPLPGERTGSDGIDPRLRRAEESSAAALKMIPHLKAWHPTEPDHFHEDGELQLPDFASYNWEWAFVAPRWRDYHLSHDQTPHYEYGRTVLKIMQWQSGTPQRWLLKSPQHFEQLRPIMNVYPDALVVFTHRDPVDSLQSILSMQTYTARTKETTPDPNRQLMYWTDRAKRLLEGYVRDVDSVPSSQRFDVVFDEFVRDDVSMVEKICEAAGLPLDNTARDQITRYNNDHKRGVHGSIVYDLEGDFGTTPESLRAEFDFYTAYRRQ